MKTTALGVLVATFLALLPFITSSQLFYGAINAKFFAFIILTDIALLMGAHAFYKNQKVTSPKGRWLLLALLLALLTQFASAVFGVFPERSFWSDIFWSSGVLFLTHVAVLAMLLGEFLTEYDWVRIRRAIAVSAGVFGIFLLVGTNGLGYTGKILGLDFAEGSISLGNETYAGAYLILALVIALIEFFRSERGTAWRRILGASIAFIMLSPILINSGLLLGKVPFTELFTNPAVLLGDTRASSAALLVLVGYLAGYLLLRRFLPRAWSMQSALAWSAVVVAGILVPITLLFVPGSVVQNAYIEESTAARVLVWGSAFEAFKERPFLGWGPENLNLAIERHFDNRIFEDKNYGEIWFERAHNVFLDTLASVGVVGATAALLVLIAYVAVVYRARRGGRIGEMEAVLLFALPLLHLLQMQTGFDTVGSYILLGIVCGYALSLERSGIVPLAPKQDERIGASVAAAGVILAVLSTTFVLLPEYGRQAALLTTFTSRTPAEQIRAIDESLSRMSSFESLRMSSASFIKGSLASVAEAPSPEKTKLILSFLDVYEKHYRAYLAAHPDHYRAHMNYAYLLLIETTLGKNRTEDAKVVIENAYELSPGNPLTYIMDALAELYSGNLAESDRLTQEALAVNPDIEFTQEAAAYFKRQQQLFPNLTALKLENL